jgi:hypothetical protein
MAGERHLNASGAGKFIADVFREEREIGRRNILEAFGF